MIEKLNIFMNFEEKYKVSIFDLIKFRDSNITDFNKIDDQSLLEINSENPEYWRFLSLLFIRSRRFKSAISACKKNIKFTSANDFEAVSRAKRAVLLSESFENGVFNENKFVDLFHDKYIESLPLAGNKPCLKSIKDFFEFDINKNRPVDNELIENYDLFKYLIERLNSAEHIALVANGSSLNNTGYGKFIDSHDEIIRINYSDINGYENDVGSKTTLILTSNQHFNGESNISSSIIGMARYPGVKTLLLDAAHKTFTPPVPKLSGITNDLISMPHEIRACISKFSYDFPTTGLTGIIFILLVLNKNISAFGFDFYSNPNSVYYNHNVAFEPIILHEIDFEKLLAKAYLPFLTSEKIIFY